MNMPYISLQTAFQIIDEVANEYDTLAKKGDSSEVKQVGRVGLTASLKIKKALLKEIKKKRKKF